MLLSIIILYVITYVFQIYIAKLRYKHIINPITIFLVIFFLHNWSYSFTRIIFNNELPWGGISTDYSSMKNVLLINYSCLWGFFLSFVFFAKKTKKETFRKIFYNQKIYTKLYYILTIIYFSIHLRHLGGTYGEDQAIDASMAFNPITTILSTLRIISACVVISNTSRKKELYILLLCEILGLFILQGRKNFIIILVALFLRKFEYYRFRFSLKTIFIIVFLYLFVSYASIFTMTYRSINVEMMFLDKLKYVNNNIFSKIGEMSIIALNSANSEGVQNWTYQLIDNGELPCLYGLSYVQSFVNTIVLRPYQGDLVNYQAAYYFKSVAYPDVVNMGYDFTFTAEAMLNWHNYAFISYFILGLFVAFLYNKRQRSNFYYTLYILLISILFIMLRTDSTSLLRYISVYFISFIFFRVLKLIRKYDFISNK